MIFEALLRRISQTARDAIRRIGTEINLVVELERKRRAFEAEFYRRASIPRSGRYAEFLRSEWWRLIRGHSLRYLGNSCEFCAQRAVNVHHVIYFPRSRRGLEGIQHLYGVCRRCHDIAHGLNVGQPTSKCAFCQQTAVAELKIAYLRHANPIQHVCAKCSALARGDRRRARGWANSKYRMWVLNWYTTIPSFLRDAEDVVEDEGAHRADDLAFERTRIREQKDSALLLQRESYYSQLSTDDLLDAWTKREESQIPPREREIILRLLRKRLKIER